MSKEEFRIYPYHWVILFIIGMDQFKSPDTHSMTLSLVALVALLFISFIIGTSLRESEILRKKNDK